MAEVARVLGMPNASLSNWVRQSPKLGLTKAVGMVKAPAVTDGLPESHAVRATLAGAQQRGAA